jgi:hypothetical protein
MPPIRSESRQKLAKQEGKFSLALSGIKDGRVKSLREAARLYAIPRATLQTRSYGVVSMVETPSTP